MKTFSCFLWCIIMLVNSTTITHAQKNRDTTKQNSSQTDTTAKKKHIPRIATERSALIPGWGQAYNKEYWKIPIVYGALAIPVYTFFYNDSYYKKTKFAYNARYKAQLPVGQGRDSTDYFNIDPEIKTLGLASLQTYRNSFRRDRDYSILWFFILWGINVVDATVFGHLKDFDVSDNLSLNIRPTYNPFTKVPGVGMALNVKQPNKKLSSFSK